MHHTEAHIEAFAAGLMEIGTHSLVAPGRPLDWIIIANPKAGGFTIPSRWKRHYTALGKSLEKAGNNPRRKDSGPCPVVRDLEPGQSILGKHGVLLTRGQGHVEQIIRDIVSALSVTIQDGTFHLIITAGGDGTSLEVLNVLYEASPELRSNFAVLRLPLGTGNDGADAWELDTALDLLLYPSRIELSRALRLTTATGQGPFYAFNILSIGLDAFVTHMTNRMKGNLPGDSYKLWVDIAALLYDRLYRVGPMTVRGFDNTGNLVQSFQEALLLLAVGVSGHRTYGSHKWILPDERNVCALKQMSLFRKLALKGLFNTGGHIDKPESILFNAHRVEFQGAYPILAQMDGETVVLQPEDFPGVIELSEPVIPLLKNIREIPAITPVISG